MAIRTEIAPAHPAPIATVRVRAEVRRGVDLAVAPSRGYQALWWTCGCRWARGTAVLTGVAVRLGGEAHKGFRLAATLTTWAWGRRCSRTHSGVVAGPRPMKHDAQPYKRDQH
jgi:hypothetical protein